MSTTPIFPESVYDNLPPFLKQITDQFLDPREKDVALTSSLIILSGCLNKIEGVYATDWVHPNLYGFVVAPPASGKGVMKYPQQLGMTIHKELLKRNDEARAKYETENRIWKKQQKKGEKTSDPAPQKPKYPILFIPGNTSSTSIYKRLNENNGIGIICESEADTLSGAIKQDWGNFSDLLRKAFHHEPLSISRSGEDLYVFVERPQLTVLLTGTPDQVPRLIGSVQDGLCSRFLFYCYSRDLQWIDPTPCKECTDLGEYFEKLSKTVASIEKQFSDSSYSFKLTDEQFSVLSENFIKKIQTIKLFEGNEAGSAVIRLGIIAFRIAMILTVLSQNDSLNEIKDLVCSEKDFQTTMTLIDVYFEHSMLMYSLLPNQSTAVINPKLRQFYALLPPKDKFARKKANEIGAGIGIKERTVGNYLTKLTEDKYLINPEYGIYEKPLTE